MTRLAILFAGSAALSLAACGGADEADDTTVIETETVEPAPAPTVTETVIEEDADGQDSVTVSRDGVEADVSDGDTRVTVDTDGNPSIRVQD